MKLTLPAVVACLISCSNIVVNAVQGGSVAEAGPELPQINFGGLFRPFLGMSGRYVQANNGKFYVGKPTTSECKGPGVHTCYLPKGTYFYQPKKHYLTLSSAGYFVEQGANYSYISGQTVYLDSAGAMSYTKFNASNAPKGALIQGWGYSYGTIIFTASNGSYSGAFTCAVPGASADVLQIYYNLDDNLPKNCTYNWITNENFATAYAYTVD